MADKELMDTLSDEVGETLVEIGWELIENFAFAYDHDLKVITAEQYSDDGEKVLSVTRFKLVEEE